MRSPPQSKRDRNLPRSYASPPFSTAAAAGRRALERFGPQRLEQALGQAGRVENRAEQQKTTSRVRMPGHFQEHITHFAIADETLRALQQPDIELALGGAQVRNQLGVVALRVIH